MTNSVKYPFQQVNVFSISVSIKRERVIPAQSEIPMITEAKTIEPGFPRLQLNLRIKTPPNTPISLEIETVGLFDYVGEKEEYNKELNQEFVTEKALNILWMFTAQLVSIVTSQMGMESLRLNLPSKFELLPMVAEKKTE